jgi:molybdopterin converting factor subunit 1
LNPFDILLFASARDLAGCDSLRLELPAGSTVADLASSLVARLPALATLLPKCRIAVNHEFANPGQVLNLGDELAVIPPVSGG